MTIWWNCLTFDGTGFFMMRFIAIILLMVMGTSHGWAKTDVDLFWPDHGSAAVIVGGAGFVNDTFVGFDFGTGTSTQAQFSSLNLAQANSPSHIEMGYMPCSAEIAANGSPASSFCGQGSKLFTPGKSVVSGFDSNSFIFRPPIR